MLRTRRGESDAARRRGGAWPGWGLAWVWAAGAATLLVALWAALVPEVSAQSLPSATVAAPGTVVVGEDAGTVSATVTLSSTSSSPITVNYIVGNSNRDGVSNAESGSDFTTLPGSVTVPANMATADIEVTLSDDAVVEGREILWLELSDGAGYTVGNPDSKFILIDDDDVPEAVEVPGAGRSSRRG